MNKTLATIYGDNLTYYPGKSFEEVVLKALEAQIPTDIYIDIIGEDGFQKDRVYVGNTHQLSGLTKDDYYAAYDQL